MKYMGSKRSMLKNGLGELVKREATSARRFIDLFTGSGSVAMHVANSSSTPVLAVDIQLFAVTLAAAVLDRDAPRDADSIWFDWSQRAAARLKTHPMAAEAFAFESLPWGSARRRYVKSARELCAEAPEGSIVASYGGHYFSPRQALELESLRESIPNFECQSLCLAALIVAASECAASPGHTAQPFQPTATAARFLFEAWRRDVYDRTRRALNVLASKHAKVKGSAYVADAESAARGLDEGDVAFLDPPYSDVHYSRFYHVLETVARGTSGKVDGNGRYPPTNERPRSAFSIRSESNAAIERLLGSLASRGVRTIVTFPAGTASNGISGAGLTAIANRHFHVSSKTIGGQFSTLGGRQDTRGARVKATELVLVLRPR